MTEHEKRNLTVIDGIKTEEKIEPAQNVSHQTNPILKKLLDFHNVRAGKFSVKDLFKK